jgi:hypothetical protein
MQLEAEFMQARQPVQAVQVVEVMKAPTLQRVQVLAAVLVQVAQSEWQGVQVLVAGTWNELKSQ